MRRIDKRQLAIAAVPVAILVFAIALSLSRPRVVVVSPTPTATPTVAVTTAPPTPSPSPSPSPSPEPTAPATRQPTPMPTISYIAGDRMLPFYFEFRAMFPIMPPAPVIQPDDQADVVEHASFNGLDAQGQPLFTVGHDFVMDRGTAAHEFGHAYQKVLEVLNPNRDVLAMYWSFRGFPGTWQEADAQSRAQPLVSGQWNLSPRESWAEAFRAAITLQAAEKTIDYGKRIDPPAARQFFLSLMKK